MYKIELSPYTKLFYTEWLLEPTSSRYNLSIDQTLYGNLDVKRLKTALKRYVSEHVVLNSHIKNTDKKISWVPNSDIRELEYLDKPSDPVELLNYVDRSFDLYNWPLYRFRLIRIKDVNYKTAQQTNCFSIYETT